MSSYNPKTLSRLLATQIIYCYQVEQGAIDKIKKQVIQAHENGILLDDDEQEPLELNHKYCEKLVELTLYHLEEIDGYITQNLKSGWSIPKLNKILLALLRVGIAELLYLPDAPPKVILSQFADIAGNTLNKAEVAFVNSIMQSVCSKHRLDHLEETAP